MGTQHKLDIYRKQLDKLYERINALEDMSEFTPAQQKAYDTLCQDAVEYEQMISELKIKSC